jgi:predicted ATPase with chaperone activity
MSKTLWVSKETNRLIKQARSLADGEREKTQVVRDALREYIQSRTYESGEKS